MVTFSQRIRVGLHIGDILLRCVEKRRCIFIILIDKITEGHKLGFSPTDFMRGLKGIELFLCIV